MGENEVLVVYKLIHPDLAEMWSLRFLPTSVGN